MGKVRLIDANALISDSRICGNCKDYEICDGNIAFCPNASARRAINDAPTVEAEPDKGWISLEELVSALDRRADSKRENLLCWSEQGLYPDGFGGAKVGYTCPYCKQYVPYAGKYCGKCGERVAGGDE